MGKAWRPVGRGDHDRWGRRLHGGLPRWKSRRSFGRRRKRTNLAAHHSAQGRSAGQAVAHCATTEAGTESEKRTRMALGWEDRCAE